MVLTANNFISDAKLDYITLVGGRLVSTNHSPPYHVMSRSLIPISTCLPSKLRPITLKMSTFSTKVTF